MLRCSWTKYSRCNYPSLLNLSISLTNTQTVTKDNKKHSLLFDVGPEEDAWERNAKRLSIDLASIERIQLSHWHRDHSGGMLRAISMITSAKANEPSSSPVTIDLHPDRPDYRGFMANETPISYQADPSFSEMTDLGAIVETDSEAHTVLDTRFSFRVKFLVLLPMRRA